MSAQQPLNFEPEPVRVPTPDPRVEREARPRLSRQCIAILERLKEGNASGCDLLLIAHRYGARLHELRKAGYQIDIVARDVASGFTEYALVDAAPSTVMASIPHEHDDQEAW